MPDAVPTKKLRQFKASLVLRKHANSKPFAKVGAGVIEQPEHAPAASIIRAIAGTLAEIAKDHHELVALKLEIGEPGAFPSDPASSPDH